MKKYIHLFLSLFFCLHLGAHDLIMMPGYKNSIEDVEVYDEHGAIVIEFAFANEDPVCNYVPLSFEESVNNKIKRYHIPLTQMNEQQLEEIIQYVENICKNIGINLNISICDAPCVGIDCLFTFVDDLKVEKLINDEEKTVLFKIY